MTSPADIAIRVMAAGDIDAIVAIQSASSDAAQWSREAYAGLLPGSAAGTRCLVAEGRTGAQMEVVGFACYRVVGSEAEFLNLAVLPVWHRLGIGARLLGETIREAGVGGARDMFLEVRESNAAALGLYNRFGFELNHRRHGYYSNPPSDALTLRLRLDSPQERTVC